MTIIERIRSALGLCNHEWTQWGKPFGVIGFSEQRRRSCTARGMTEQRAIGDRNIHAWFYNSLNSPRRADKE